MDADCTPFRGITATLILGFQLRSEDAWDIVRNLIIPNKIFRITYIRYQSPDCPDYVMLLVAILGFNRRAGQVLKAAGGHNARQPHSLITEVFCPGAEATEQR